MGPIGWGSFKGMAYGMLKGCNTSSPCPLVDTQRGNLNPATYTLVKASQLAGTPEQQDGGGSSGLSAGAIAGAAPAALASGARMGKDARHCFGSCV